MLMTRYATVGPRTKRWRFGQHWTRILLTADCGLTLHPDKTKIVYCRDESRRGTYPVFEFDFLGYTFRPRFVSKRAGDMGVSFTPAASPTALKAIRGTVRRWALHRPSGKALDDRARMFNSYIRGWIN